VKAALALVLVAAATACGGSGEGGEAGVERASLSPGRIALTFADAASVQQVIVNDAFVDFRTSCHVITVRYPWIEGESYDLELLTSTGATVEYEIEDAESA
jgi:zinc transporter, ZIP family